MKIVSHTIGEQRDGCMISAVFEPKRRFVLKKEISSRLEKTYEETMVDNRLWGSFACFD
jgi:hypothetical protein